MVILCVSVLLILEPVNGWIEKDSGTYNGILPSPTREENPAICDNMEELEDVVLKSTRPSTESSVWRDLACMPNYKDQIHRSREQDGLPKDVGEKEVV